MTDMQVVTHYLTFETGANYQMMDITEEVAREIKHCGLKNGTVTLFVVGSTAALTTIEYESGLVQDFAELFHEIVPQNKRYHHNDRWHDGNGHSHVRSSLLGPSLTIPCVDGRMTLGTWQQIVFVDFDVPARSRKVVLQMMGEIHSVK